MTDRVISNDRMCGSMARLLYDIEISRDANQYIARMRSRLRSVRSYKSNNFEELMEQIVKDIQDENEE